jgi:hypothetical protein
MLSPPWLSPGFHRHAAISEFLRQPATIFIFSCFRSSRRGFSYFLFIVFCFFAAFTPHIASLFISLITLS